jgi:hypothetical protein
LLKSQQIHKESIQNALERYVSSDSSLNFWSRQIVDFNY